MGEPKSITLINFKDLVERGLYKQQRGTPAMVPLQEKYM